MPLKRVAGRPGQSFVDKPGRPLWRDACGPGLDSEVEKISTVPLPRPSGWRAQHETSHATATNEPIVGPRCREVSYLPVDPLDLLVAIRVPVDEPLSRPEE